MKKQNFIWSTSTNAFQIEGARHLDNRTDSIWDEFTKKHFYIPPIGSNEREINSIKIAADFYHHYKQDAKIMKNASLNGFIYNLDWTRIYPNNENEINQLGLDWTIEMFKTMSENGIKPIPILFHWDHPMWAEKRGGWTNRQILDWFRNYVATMFKYLGKYSDLWFVNDENSSFTLSGYLSDYNPPMKNSKQDFVDALHLLNMSGAIAKEEFKKAKELGYLSDDAMLGIDHDWSVPIAYKNNKDNLKAVETYNQWFLNLFLDPNMKGTYPEVFYQWIIGNNLKNPIINGDLEYLQDNLLDFIGWNYYRPAYIASMNQTFKEGELQKDSEIPFDGFQIIYPKKNVKYTSWNWIIDSSKLVDGAFKLTEEYGKNIPLMIVENGIGAFDNKERRLIKDPYRVEYLKDHIEAVLEAKKQGINFIGYSVWTYCDIYSPSGGYRKDYGLINIDFNSPLRMRKPKMSYVYYKQVVESNGNNTAINWRKLEQDLVNEMNNQEVFGDL